MSNPGGTRDFLILAVQDAELNALLKIVDSHRPVETIGPHTRSVYEVNLASTDTQARTGIVASIGRVGRVDAAIAAANLLNFYFAPTVLLLGLAGGFGQNKVKLGDVLVATQIVDYEMQRIRDADIETRWRIFNADEQLLLIARKTSDTNWWTRMTPNPLSGRPPAVHFGPVLSGDKVIASARVVKTFLEVRPDVLGIEMEGAGVAAVVSQTKISTRFVMIRGVADLSSDSKRDEVKAWGNYACEAAAVFGTSILRRLQD